MATPPGVAGRAGDVGRNALCHDPYPALAVWIAWAAGWLAVERWLHAGDTGDVPASPERLIDKAFELSARGL